MSRGSQWLRSGSSTGLFTDSVSQHPPTQPQHPPWCIFLQCTWSSLVLGAHMISDDRDPPPVCLPSPLLSTHPPTKSTHQQKVPGRPPTALLSSIHPVALCISYNAHIGLSVFFFVFSYFCLSYFCFFSPPVKSANDPPLLQTFTCAPYFLDTEHPGFFKSFFVSHFLHFLQLQPVISYNCTPLLRPASSAL